MRGHLASQSRGIDRGRQRCRSEGDFEVDNEVDYMRNKIDGEDDEVVVS